jgi:hypothetical protein
MATHNAGPQVNARRYVLSLNYVNMDHTPSKPSLERWQVPFMPLRHSSDLFKRVFMDERFMHLAIYISDGASLQTMS